MGMNLCITLVVSAALAAAPDDAKFEKLADDSLAAHLRFRPHVALELGLHEHDGKLADYQFKSLEGEHARLVRVVEEVEKFPPAGLSHGVQIDRQVLLCGLREALFEFEGMQSYRRNPITYIKAIQIDNYLIRDYAPLAERVRSIISVERQIPQLLAAGRENLLPALPRQLIETAIKVTGGAADFLERDLPPAVARVEDKVLLAELNTVNKQAIQELRDFATWLKTEKLPKSDTRFAIGRDNFARMLRDLEMVALAPEEVLALGLRELRREQEIFAATAKLIDPTRPAHDVFVEIQEDHPIAERLIPDTAMNLELIRKFILERKLISFPSDIRVKVAETPQFRRAVSFASMEAPGPFETRGGDAYYYVTPVDPTWSAVEQNQWLTAFNYYTTDVVSIHEAYPGHYLQDLHRNASPASKIRKAFSSYAFVEGWAHYTEQMALDEGFPPGNDRLKTAKYRLAQSDEALLRLCRLCCAIQMHCNNMSVEEATKFFRDNCYYQETPARQEAVRGTHDPKYLNYTLGKLMILKLREDWQKQEGSKFTLQRYHDEMLRHGAPAIPVLRQLMLQDSAMWKQAL